MFLDEGDEISQKQSGLCVWAEAGVGFILNSSPNPTPMRDFLVNGPHQFLVLFYHGYLKDADQTFAVGWCR